MRASFGKLKEYVFNLNLKNCSCGAWLKIYQILKISTTLINLYYVPRKRHQFLPSIGLLEIFCILQLIVLGVLWCCQMVYLLC